MARLIDYHTNCGCGADVHTTADLDDEGYLSVTTATTGANCTMQADAGAHLGGVMAPLQADAIDDEAEAAEVDDDAPVATSAPAQAPAAPPRRGRPPRAGGGG